jgi:serine/threonine protein kinase
MTDNLALEPDRRWVAEATAGRYEVLHEIGRGGMSRVLLAWDRTGAREVALKLLSSGPAASLEGRERFRREALITARANHPHIVPCYEFVCRGSRAMAVMRYVPGHSLADRLSGGDSARLDARALLAILVPIADALAHVHRLGVVHRDVKPANILLHADDGWPFLTDFGVATLRTSDHSCWEATQRLGTPEFMSPEQALGAWDADHRSDIYSLGLVAYVALTGASPFGGGPALALAAQRAALDVPPLSRRTAGVPEPLAVIVDRCLARDPRQRWRDAGALCRALTRVARRLTPRARPRRWWDGWREQLVASLRYGNSRRPRIDSSPARASRVA